MLKENITTPPSLAPAPLQIPHSDFKAQKKCLERLGEGGGRKAKRAQPEFAAGSDEKAGHNTHIHTHTVAPDVS